MSVSRTEVKTDLVIPEEEIIRTDTVLGEGACCRVFKAAWRGAPVAIKSLKVDSLLGASARSVSDQTRLDVLLKELHVMCELRYPNIVMLYGVYAPETPYAGLVMELMETSLKDRTTKGPALRPPCIVHVLRDVTAALAYLHYRHVIHRDVCPRNILLSGDTAQSHGHLVAKLADFAASKIVDTIGFDPRSSMSGQFGTLPYLPYEAIDKDPITEKYVYSSTLDVYSVGAVGLFAALQKIPGVSPRFKPDYLQKLGTEHMLYGIIKECLYDDPPQRPSSADLQVRLQTLQASEACQNCNSCLFSTGAASLHSEHHQEATAVPVLPALPTSAQSVESSIVVSTANQTQLSRQQNVNQVSSPVQQARQVNTVVTNPHLAQQTAATSSAEQESLLSEPAATLSSALSSQAPTLLPALSNSGQTVDSGTVVSSASEPDPSRQPDVSEASSSLRQMNYSTTNQLSVEGSDTSSVVNGSAPQESLESNDSNYNYCALCLDGGELLLCDACNLAYHLGCLNSTHKPEGDWICPVCKCDESAPPFPPGKDPSSISVPSSWKTKWIKEHLDITTIKKCYMLWKYLHCHMNSYLFRQPVKEDEAPGYKRHIRNPMDLSTIEMQFENGVYRKMEDFVSDLFLIFDNCDRFNKEYSEPAGVGRYMRGFLCQKLQELQLEHLSRPKALDYIPVQSSGQLPKPAALSKRKSVPPPALTSLLGTNKKQGSLNTHADVHEPPAKRPRK